MSGFIGFVEFGVRCGSQFAAGRSNQAMEGSPCSGGSTNGTSFGVFPEPFPATAPWVAASAVWSFSLPTTAA